MAGMAMDPVAASQGMFGGYGMNMSGMNMGMNFDADQGMYDGWGGVQGNSWNEGAQDKFNPSAFPNAMGSFGGGPSGFGGFNIPNGNYAQMQFPNPDFQNGYQNVGGYAGRGGFRGRGRGFMPGGRSRYEYSGGNYHPFNADLSSVPPQGQNSSVVNEENPSQQPLDDVSPTADFKEPNGQPTLGDGQELPTGEKAPSGETVDSTQANDVSPFQADTAAAVDNTASFSNETQLQGIPTIDSIDEASATQPMYNGSAGIIGQQMGGYMGPGFGRGYMRSSFQAGRGGPFVGGKPGMAGLNMPSEPSGQGVVGAPAAPKAMREGLPNTSVFRRRGVPIPGHTASSASLPR